MNGEINRKLEAALEGVYAAFADMTRPIYIQHELYELRPDEIRDLLGLPLRQLLPELVRSYKFEAVTCVGTWDDYRYSLPRILEMLTTTPDDPDHWEQLEDVACRLRYAHENGGLLSEAQARALCAYALAWWNAFLEADPYILPAEMILNWGTLQTFGPTHAELLALWRQHPNGAVHLAHTLVCYERAEEWPLPDWSKAEAATWLEAAFFADPHSKNAQLMSDALLILRA